MLRALPLLLLLIGTPPPLRAQTLTTLAPGITRIDPPPGAGGWGTAIAVHGPYAAISNRSEYVGGVLPVGAVHLFRHDGTAWHSEGRLTPPGDSTAQGNFGSAVAFTRIGTTDVLAVGADGMNTGYGDVPYRQGYVYLFHRDHSSGGAWQPDTVLTGYWYQDNFGRSLSFDGSRLAVGQWGYPRGKVFIFEHDAEGRWTKTAEIDGTSSYNVAGYQVSLSGDLLMTMTRADEPYERQNIRVYHRGESGQWAYEADLVRVTDSVVTGMLLTPREAWLSEGRVMTSVWVPEKDKPIDEGRSHVLMLSRTASGRWRLEADLDDRRAARMMRSESGGVPLSGRFAVVGVTEMDSSVVPARLLGARVYRWTGDRWAVHARLPRAGVVSAHPPTVQAVGEDGRFVAMKYLTDTNTPLVLYDVSLLATGADREARMGSLEMRAVPSPARNVVLLSFTLPEASAGRMEVVNTLGQVVHAVQVAPGETLVPLDVSSWAPGVYVAQIGTGNAHATTTFVVAR